MKYNIKRHGAPTIIVVAIIVAIVITWTNHKIDHTELIFDGHRAYDKIPLPTEFVKGELSTFDAIDTRRSIRDYSKEAISLAELATLLHTTQGETATGRRAAPSAGGLYPIETYVVVNNVEGLDAGLYHYLSSEHSLEKIKTGHFGIEMASHCMGQAMCKDAAVVFVWTAVFDRTTRKYGSNADHMVYLEAGHISENLYLQGNSMGIGVVAIGGFIEEMVDQFLGVNSEIETVVYINAVGKKLD